MTILRIWKHWTTPTTTGDLAQRRESVLLTILAAMVALSIATQILQLANLAAGAHGVIRWWLLDLGFGLLCFAMLHGARIGKLRQSAIALLVILSVVALLVTLSGGTDHAMPSVLLALIVLLAAVLLGGTASLGIAAALGAGYIALGITQAAKLWTPPAHGNSYGVTAGAVTLVVIVCAAICRTYTRDVLTSIDETLTRQAPASPLRQLRTKHLSLREIEIVQLVAEGLTNDTIAAKLFLSPRTVQTHVANAMRKTETANRTELGVLAVREGLAPLDLPQPERAAG